MKINVKSIHNHTHDFHDNLMNLISSLKDLQLKEVDEERFINGLIFAINNSLIKLEKMFIY